MRWFALRKLGVSFSVCRRALSASSAELEWFKVVESSKLLSSVKDEGVLRRALSGRDNVEDAVEHYMETHRLWRNFNELEDMKQDEEGEMLRLIEADLSDMNHQLNEKCRALIEVVSGVAGDVFKPVYVEVFGAVGGVEARLFAADLVRFYKILSAFNGWNVDLIDVDTDETGGVRRTVLLIDGMSCRRWLTYEAGIHRVQRIPANAKVMHTSTVGVFVWPADSDEAVKLNEADLQVTAVRSGGGGGQHANVTNSKAIVVHKPTGLRVTCEDQRFFHLNIKIAKANLQKLLNYNAVSLREKNEQQERQKTVGSVDRSDKIRTYNYQRNRITDHRFGGFTITCGSVLETLTTEKGIRSMQGMFHHIDESFQIEQFHTIVDKICRQEQHSSAAT